MRVPDEALTVMSDPPMNPTSANASGFYITPVEESLESLTEEEQSRRQKTCRVCGDHASGYNFNVISCESCKAFFRRNALKPKDFKCPYTGDCEINSVSRRFCQLCRLKKCFRVGMKKEWILNDEQLKRRKNSRLNSLKSVNSVPGSDPMSPQQMTPRSNLSSVPSLQSPITSLPSPLARNHIIEDTIASRDFVDSPILTQLSTTQIQTPAVSQQTPSFIKSMHLTDIRNANNGGMSLRQLLSSSNDMQSQPSFNPLLAQYSRQLSAGSTLVSLSEQNNLDTSVFERSNEQPVVSQNPITEARISSNLQQLANVSIEERSQLMQRQTSQPSAAFPSPQFTRPITSEMVSTGAGVVEPCANAIPYDQSHMDTKSIVVNVATSPEETIPQNASQFQSPNSSFMFPPFFDWSPRTFSMMEKSIQDEFENCSPSDFNHNVPEQVEFRDTNGEEALPNYQLNSSELTELDVVRNAYICMDEPLNDSKDAEAFKKKTDHSPSDVMNIIDIIMRRFVKMTKKLPVFNTLTQDTKLSLLKSAMIKMVTMRGARRFDPKRMCWSSSVIGRQNFNVSCDIFDRLNDTYQKSNFIRFCSSIHDVIRKNDVVINLVGLIILFGNTKVVKSKKDKVLVEKYHTLYNNLLRRYIESSHGSEASSIFQTIPLTLTELDRLSTVAETIFVGKVESASTKKLPMEFFKTRPEEVAAPTQSLSSQSNQPTSSS